MSVPIGASVHLPEVVDEVLRLRMSYDEWLAMPDRPRSEWVAGVVVVMPPEGGPHSDTQFALSMAVRAGLQGVRVYSNVGFRLPHDRVRAPDVMVVTRPIPGGITDEIPALAIEVISSSSRTEDTVRKPVEYAGGGVGQFWLVDPRERCLDAFRNVEGEWEPLLHLDDDHPTGTIAVADFGEVTLDLGRILPAD